jgi:hypothetical protein
LDALTSCLSNIYVSEGIDGDTSRGIELTVPRTGQTARLPIFRKEVTITVEFLDTVVGSICNVYVSRRIRRYALGGIKLTVTEFKRTGAIRIYTSGTGGHVTLAAPFQKEIPIAVEFLDTVILRICNIYVARSVYDNPSRRIELTVRRT